MRPIPYPAVESELGTNTPVKASFWPSPGPFFRQKLLNPYKVFPSRSAAGKPSREGDRPASGPALEPLEAGEGALDQTQEFQTPVTELNSEMVLTHTQV